MDAFLWGEHGDDIFGVRPARHDARADKRGGLDMMQPGLGERLDQLDLVGGADRAGFDLKPFARAFLVDLHMCRQIAHGHFLRQSPIIELGISAPPWSFLRKQESRGAGPTSRPLSLPGQAWTPASAGVTT